jgi:hypothetical protein
LGKKFTALVETLAPKGLTPHEFICKIWTQEPKRFSLNPAYQMPGLPGSLAVLGMTGE